MSLELSLSIESYLEDVFNLCLRLLFDYILFLFLLTVNKQQGGIDYLVKAR